MGDLKAIGSEKLEGIDKLRRIMEIAKYKETPKQEVDNFSTTNYTIRLADGKIYGIVKEKTGYVIKNGIHESYLDYIDQMRNRKHYRSYSEAMKKLNLIVSEVNRNEGNDYEIPLLGEQPTKKFTLKTKKSTPPPSTDMGAAPDMGEMPAPPAPEGEGMPPAAPPAPEGEGMPPMGDEEGDDIGEMPPAPEGDDDMDEMPPAPEEDEDEDNNEGDPMNLKMIQKLTGKLSQKIRALDKEKGMDSQDIKYVINSIISAIDMKNLDDEDREEIVDKIEGFDEEYGEDGDETLDLDNDDLDDDEFGPDTEPDTEETMGDETTEPVAPEPTEGYQSVMDSIFSESQVEKVLFKYFDIKNSEKPLLDEKRKKNYLLKKLAEIEQKKDLINFSVTSVQRKKAINIFEGYDNTTFIGKTNKNNLVIDVDGKRIKVLPNGRII